MKGASDFRVSAITHATAILAARRPRIMSGTQRDGHPKMAVSRYGIDDALCLLRRVRWRVLTAVTEDHHGAAADDRLLAYL